MKVSNQAVGVVIFVGLGLLLVALMSRRDGGGTAHDLPRMRLEPQGRQARQYINEEEIDLKWGPDYMLQKIVIHRHATEA